MGDSQKNNVKLYYFLRFVLKNLKRKSGYISLTDFVNKNYFNLLDPSKSKKEIENIILKILGSKNISELWNFLLWDNENDKKMFLLSILFIEVNESILSKSDIDRVIPYQEHIKSSALELLAQPYDLISTYIIYGKRVDALFKMKERFDVLERPNNVHAPKSSIFSIYNELKIILGQREEIESTLKAVLQISVDQSIIANSGKEFESRIDYILRTWKEVLNLERHKKFSGLEFDFVFKLGEIKYGLAVKRTLRERYKQQLQRTGDVDCAIILTIDESLSENKAKYITENETFLFIRDELYNSKTYFQNNKRIKKISLFNPNTLIEMKKS